MKVFDGVIAGLGVLLTATTLLISYYNQRAEDRRAYQQLCIEKYEQVLDRAATLASTTQSDIARSAEAEKQLAVMREAVGVLCARGALTKVEKALADSTDTAKPVTVSPPPAAPSSPTPPPVGARIYIQITDPGQRPSADALAEALRSRGLVMPGVELVAQPVSQSSLRCFKQADCKSADALVRLINQLLSEPKLGVADFSGRYENADSAKPGTYEIWFASSAKPRLAGP